MDNQYEIDGFENMDPDMPRQSGPDSDPMPRRMESPFADSPYMAAGQPEPAPQKPRKKSKAGKAILTILAVVLIIGGFIGTFVCLNSLQLENDQLRQMLQQLNGRIGDLQSQIKDNSYTGNGNSVSGTPNVSVEGLTPGQVYAQNVDSVVGISSYVSTGLGQSTQAVATGSGFIISEDGYVLTNCHVVEGASKITVTTHSGQTHTAALIGSDSTNDVALLKVEATGLKAAVLGSSDALIVGDQVVAIGNPLGELTATLTVGYVSAKDREVTTDGTIINMIQTDAAINSGNSGGPLFNMKGEVIGITTAKYSGSTSSGATIEGIGFAIPIDDVEKIAQELLEKGYVSSAYLGVYVRDSNDGIGVYIDSVEAGGSAELAGIRSGDYIIGLGEYDITSTADLTKALRKFEPGDTTTVTVFRGRKVLELSITLMEKPVENTSGTEQNPGSSAQPTQPESGSSNNWWDKFFG